jgi:NADPH-dependent 2,4-dienoyl-CoA reductase/sulfur reductase-like enzyme
MKRRCFDLLVVGAGPAGLAAAHAAARRGAKIGLVDAQPRAGGQVWRHDLRFGAPSMARAQIDGLGTAGIEWLAGHEVVLADDHAVVASHADGAVALHWRKLVIATGARELMLPFPGWTLPGVTGAGGLQALAKQGWPVAGKRVIVAGTGPLLLAAAATLRRHGAQVLGIHEQARREVLHAFARRLWRWPARLAQAVALRTRLVGVPWHAGSAVLAAQGDDTLRAVEVDCGAGREWIECDQLAVGWGLVPNVELARLLGCELDTASVHPAVRVDARLRGSHPDIHAAGEALGIGGRDCARVEGAMAACFALGDERGGEALRARRDRERAYAALLHAHFAPDARTHALATPDTLACRCEDVPMSAVQAHADPRQLRLVTRCGMGACQGRICGAALRELRLASPSLSPTAVRPPLTPVALAALADVPSDEPEQGTDP